MSDTNKTQFDENAHPIEAWYLTAYALGELDEESRTMVEAWLAKHPEDQLEIEAIRQTASRIEHELAEYPSNIQLDAIRSKQIQDSILAVANNTTEVRLENSNIDTVGRRHPQGRFLWTMVTGLAASLALGALWWSRPSANQEPLAHLPDTSKMIDTPHSGNDHAPVPTADQLPAISQAKRLDLADKTSENKTDPLSRKKENSDSLEMTVKGTQEGKQWQLKADSKRSDPADRGLALGRFSNSIGGAPAADSEQVSGELMALGGSAGGSGGPPVADYKREFDGLKQEPLSDFPEELRQNVPSFQRSSRGTERVAGDRFDVTPETPFVAVDKEPLSTFSIDVDTASYSKLRQYVMENQVVPPPSAVRIEEWLNYFDYQYPGPQGAEPFAAHLKLGDCPWNTKHKIVRVGIQARKVSSEERPKSNLVFLIDVSGSMADANKLPLVKRTLGLLTSQLREQDRVAIVVYAGASGCVLPSTSGIHKDQILASINELQSGGSTNGGSGIELAYKIAKENYIPGGVNRVLLCTDGDFNVGVTGTDALVSMMQEQAKSNIFLTCLGYGIGNYNDSMMEQISGKGNGTYAMIDNEREARRVMTEQLSGTLMTVAKDVKIQIEFNPAKVHSYRLIGYENRRLAAADFNDDKKDAGEIGAGHRVTALYEIVPVGQAESIPGAIDELRFSKSDKSETKRAEDATASTDWLLLKIRSKPPESSESTKQEFVLGEIENQIAYEGQQSDFDWALSVAEFGLLMRQSELAPGLNWEKMLARAIDSTSSDPYRIECITIMQRAKALLGQ
jgi:Ca-activated chloride channel family protein